MKTKFFFAIAACVGMFATSCQKETLDEPQPVTAASASQFSGTAYLWMGFAKIPYTIYFDQDYSPGYYNTSPKPLFVAGPESSFTLPWGVQLPYEIGEWKLTPENVLPISSLVTIGCSAQILSSDYTTARDGYPGRRYYGTIRVWNITTESPQVWFRPHNPDIGGVGDFLIPD